LGELSKCFADAEALFQIEEAVTANRNWSSLSMSLQLRERFSAADPLLKVRDLALQGAEAGSFLLRQVAASAIGAIDKGSHLRNSCCPGFSK
jgi:hypothetical protein